MAYALKYHHNFHQIKDYSGSTEWRLEVYLEGYAGSASELENVARNSVIMSRDGDLLDNVFTTKLTFSVDNETEAQYKEFRTASWGDYMVKLIFDPSGSADTKFLGYNQSEIYTEPYNQPPYASKLEFTCGLSHLKHVRWEDSGTGTLYTGQKTIIEVLRLALNKLPNPIGLREFVNVYEDSILSTTISSMLNQIWVDSTVYKEKENKDDSSIETGFFCYKVIEEILKPFNAHIYHANGTWYIVRTQEYLDTTMYYRNYNANVGTESSVTISGAGSFSSNKRTVTGVNGTATEMVLQAQATQMSIDPPINRAQITYKQENLDVVQSSIIKNGNWGSTSTVNGTSGNVKVPDFWTMFGDNWDNYNSFFSSKGLNFNQFEPVDQKTNSVINYSKYITQTKTGIATDTNDTMQFYFNAAFLGRVDFVTGGNFQNNPENFIKNTLEFTWECEIKMGSYYLGGDSIAGYNWGLTGTTAKFTKKGMPVEVSYSNSIKQHFEILETLPTLPQNAIVDFSIKIYKPYHNWATYAATNNDFTMQFYNLGTSYIRMFYLPDNKPAVENLTLYSKIDEDENVEKIETIHGDGVNSFTLNSFRLASGLVTNLWDRRGKTDTAGILTILLRQLRDLRSSFLKILNGSILAEMEVYNTIEDTTDVTTVYWMRSFDWLIEESKWSNIELMELRDDTVTTLAVTTATDLITVNTQNPSGSTSGNNNDPNSNQSIVTPPSAITPNQNNLNNYN